MKRQLTETKDKSKTLLIPEMGESYHSMHGAATEAKHVFIQNGLKLLKKKNIHIFEMGLGTGLNVLVSLQHAIGNQLQIHYDSLEKYPLVWDEVRELEHAKSIGADHLDREFELIHSSPWETYQQISSGIFLKKIQGDIRSFDIEKSKYDLVYFDGFGPRHQAELWSESICINMYNGLKPGGILVTYCAQGQFKRNLLAAGFNVESPTGPPGKREMTRAMKLIIK
jgi:tRNA U34 5-methylaminomethyl-2-thiouridine-forming methyltransferase MnmC